MGFSVANVGRTEKETFRRKMSVVIVKLTGCDRQHVSAPRTQTVWSETQPRGGNA